MRTVEIARLGRGDGREAHVRTGDHTTADRAAYGWLYRLHLRRLRLDEERRLYLWSFREGWASAAPQPASREE